MVDIGSWTVDIMPITDGRPQEQECVTSPQGLIRCMREINEECVRQLGQELEESVIPWQSLLCIFSFQNGKLLPYSWKDN